MPSPVTLWNDIWETSANIPYWWGVKTRSGECFWLAVPNRKFASTNQNTTQIWVVIHHQYGILRVILRCHFSGKPVVSSRNDGCFLRQVKISELCRLTVTLVSWLLKNVTLLSLNKVAIWSNNLIGQCFFIYHHSPWSSLGPAVIQIYNNIVLMLCYFQH